jgi:hypothetical protein
MKYLSYICDKHGTLHLTQVRQCEMTNKAMCLMCLSYLSIVEYDRENKTFQTKVYKGKIL